MAELPSGTVTFLFTDIEGSTRRWEQYPQAMPSALARHDAIVRQAITAHGGVVFRTVGDAFCAAFASARSALRAALAAQRALQDELWGETGPIHVRMAVHTGAVELRDGEYQGQSLNRLARILAAGHGGQMLLSFATVELLRDGLPPYVQLRDMGAHHLKDLTRPEQIFQVVAPDLPADFPPLKTLDRRPHNLPTPPTPLIGRTVDLAALNALLADPATRLVTITGAGGMGKTRLAIALAEQLLAANRFPNGVFFVSLAPVEAVDWMVSALAEALGFPLDAGTQPARSPQQQVFDYLREKRLLLILDNLEHLLNGAEAGASDAADLVAALLGNAPGVAVLATSRERLKLHTEQVYLLGGLDMPTTEDASDSSAVALFIQSARRLRPEFAPAHDQLDVVARICRLVEGMPLAIELAAGWVDALALPDIAAEIERGLDLLATALRDVPVRHRSMRAVFDASWRRLGAAEQAVFDRLAIFRGGGTRHAVQAVTQATLPQLHALVGASLVHYDIARDSYSVHELLRQYAAEQLAADPTGEQATRDRHAAYFCGLLRDLRGELQGEHQLEALATIEADSQNVRAGWEWAARQGNAALIDQAIDSLGSFYQWQGRAEEGAAAYRLAAAALLATSTLEAQRVRAKLLAWQSRCSSLLGDSSAAGALLEQSRQLLDGSALADTDTRAERAFVLLQAGQLAVEHDPPAARQAYEESRTLFQALGDRWGEAAALFGLGAVTLNWSSNYDLAQRYLLDSLALCRTLAAQLSTIETLVIVSNNARYRGQVAESVQLARESYELSTTLANRRAIAIAGSNLGIAMSWIGNYAESQRLLQETVAIYTDLGDRAGLATAYYRLGWSELFLGRYPEARATFERGLSISRTIGDTLDIGGCLQGLTAVALAEGAYSEARRWGAEAIALLEGVGEHYFLSSAYIFSALAERGLGNQREARYQVITGLRSLLEKRTWNITIHALATIALLLADAGEPERAVYLFALVEREDPFRTSSWSFAVYRRELAAIAATLPGDVAAAAEARGMARDLWATADELLAELNVRWAEGAEFSLDEGLESSKAATSTPHLLPAPRSSPVNLPGPTVSKASVSFASADSLPREPAHNLPPELTSFVGRSREVALVGQRFAEARLVTLTGPGGIGKTRLALRAAHQLLTHFPAGAWLVELAPLADPALTVPTIATVLGLREEPDRPLIATLTGHLRDRQLLLVLDNCEHLIDACARLATDLLHAARQLRILATSREPLGVAGEALVGVPALELPPRAPQTLTPYPPMGGRGEATPPLPAWERPALSVGSPERSRRVEGGSGGEGDLAQYEAVQLFVERARAVEPAFKVTAASVAPLIRICWRLDGIALAIELAAARVRMLTLEQIAERLEDNFRLLTSGSRTAVPRHQTIQASIEWSYNLLSEPERALLRRLAVFAGGWTLEAAEAVASELTIQNEELRNDHSDKDILNFQFSIFNLLGHLVDKSLVQVDRGGSAARYRMLEPIRQFALEQLEESGEADVIRQQHAMYFLELAEEAEPWVRFMRPERDPWLARLSAEHDNLRTALQWFGERGEIEHSVRLAWALMKFWSLRYHWDEGNAWLQAALARSSTISVAARAKGLVAAGHLAFHLSDFTGARPYVEEGLSLFRSLGDKPAIAYTVLSLGRIVATLGEYALARVCAEEGLALYDEISDRWARAETLRLLADVASAQGDLTQAAVYFQENLSFYRQIGYKRGIAMGLANAGILAQSQGDWEHTVALYAESLALFREVGDKTMTANGLHNLGGAVLHQGDALRAAVCFAEGLTLSREIESRADIAINLAGMAGVAAVRGQPGRSARLFGAAEAMFDAMGLVLDPVDRTEYDGNAAVARAQLGEDAFAAAWEAGRAMPLEQVIAYALEPPAETPPAPAPPATPQPTVAAAEYPAGLTAREVEVLRLVAQGLTDAQVAERLILSTHTVHAHLRSIYGKLEVTSRTAASRFAVDHQLI